jgi:uncharacterized RDD family membrane protein YckC
VPTGYASSVDDNRPASPETAERTDAPPKSGSILSAGVGAPPVSWTTPGSHAIGGIEVAKGIVLAGIGTRIAAFLVDAFVLGALAITITLATASVVPNRAAADLIAGIIVAIFGVGYFTMFWVSPWMGTPGQRLAGLRVVDAASLEPIDARRALVRSLAIGSALTLLSFAGALSRYIEVIVVVWAMVLRGTAIFNDRRQGLHDRWARTIVVKPAVAGPGPLVFGCFQIVLIILASPFIFVSIGGPALQQMVDRLASPAPQ